MVSHREGNQPFNWKSNVFYNISYFTVHKNFIINDNYDLGIIKLTEPVKDLHKRDIPLLNTTPIPDYGSSYTLKMYGGGRTEGNVINDHLQEIDLEFSPFRKHRCRLRNIVFCYKGIRTNASVYTPTSNDGDSGSPILVDKIEEAGVIRRYLIGVHVSRVKDVRSRFNYRDSFGVAMNVMHFFTWINIVIHETSLKEPDEIPWHGQFYCCDVLEE